MITQIAHLALNVKDMDASLDFYCNKLSFKKVFEIHDDEDKPWIVYVKIADGLFIELFYGGMGSIPDSAKALGFNHFCLQCDDVYQTVEELRTHGVEIDIAPNQGKDFNTQAWIQDPDGNRIELMTISPDSPQANA